MTEAARLKYGDYVDPRREGESDDEFRRRSTLIWIVAEEEYALYGMFYQFKNKIQDDRPSTVVIRKSQDENAVLELQDSNQDLISSENKLTIDVKPSQTIDDLENYLDADVSALHLN